VAGADADVLAGLAEGNRVYEQRFGHVYLVCASGRSAEELLAVLRGRLDNDPVTERAVVRAELAAINRLRLDQLLGEPHLSGSPR
jgi:2-oxo-4-hydroxy-4-carboxy-5-ureidoimidazoline decarboxylase